MLETGRGETEPRVSLSSRSELLLEVSLVSPEVSSSVLEGVVSFEARLFFLLLAPLLILSIVSLSISGCFYLPSCIFCNIARG